jgi:hypothetical protein
MPDRPASLLQLGEVRPTRRGFDESADPSYLPSTMAIAALGLLILLLMFWDSYLVVLVPFSFRIPSLSMRERTVLG